MSGLMEITVWADPKTNKIYKTRKTWIDMLINSLNKSGAKEAGFYTFSITTNDTDMFAELAATEMNVRAHIDFNGSNFEDIVANINMCGYNVTDEAELKAAIKEAADNDLTNVYFTTDTFSISVFEGMAHPAKNCFNKFESPSNKKGDLTFSGIQIDTFLEPATVSGIGFIEIDSSVPEIIGEDYVLPSDIRILWNYFSGILRDGKMNDMARVFIHGLSGSGKTDLGKQLAHHFDCDVVFSSASQINVPTDWFYRRSVKGGETVDEMNEATMALLLETDKPLIYIIDEINRGMDAALTNPLLQMTGEQRTVEIGQNWFVHSRPVMFLFTANIGHQYTGTDLLDLALINRFDISIPMRPISEITMQRIAEQRYPDIDKSARKVLVNAIYQMIEVLIENGLGVTITVRDMLNVLRNYRSIKNERVALIYSVLNKHLNDDVRALLQEKLNVVYPI